MEEPRVRFHNYPLPIAASVYTDAVSQYAAAVSSRASAIYQVGNVHYPGLSDIDLLVVVDRASWDNNQFFSPYIRLAQPYRALFHHEPRLIPADGMDALEFSSCAHASVDDSTHQAPGLNGSRRRLVLGADVLADRVADVASTAWQRCRVLEVAYLFHRALDNFESQVSVDVVKLMSRSTALRYPMRHLHDLLGLSRDVEYERAVDSTRALLLRRNLSDAERLAAVEDIYARLATATRRFEANARALFGIRRNEEFSAVASDMLAGKRPAPGIDDAYLARRQAAARMFQAAQGRYCLGDGSIFATKPMNGSSQQYRQPFALRMASSVRWRFGTQRIWPCPRRATPRSSSAAA